jgi:hypothetical protein
MFCCGSLKRHFESFFAGDKMVKFSQHSSTFLSQQGINQNIPCSRQTWPNSPKHPQTASCLTSTMLHGVLQQAGLAGSSARSSAQQDFFEELPR